MSVKSYASSKVMAEFISKIFKSLNPRLSGIKLKMMEKLSKLIGVERSFRNMAYTVIPAIIDFEITFSEVVEKKEERQAKKKEDYEMLKKLRDKRKMTKKQEQIIKSKGFNKRVVRDFKKKDVETDQLTEMIASRNKQKKLEKMGKTLLEMYYTVVLKIIRLHYKKNVIKVGLTALLKFVNRMPVKFVGQVLINLRNIYGFMEEDHRAASIARRLKVIRTMLSLWKKVNFEDQLENQFLQKKLFDCFIQMFKLEETPSAICEDLFVNFDNLVMKVSSSDSTVTGNWFVLLGHLAVENKDKRLRDTALFLMNKMMEHYPKLCYYMDPASTNEHASKINLPKELSSPEDQSLNMTPILSKFAATLKADNKPKYLINCMVEKLPLGKKYIGIDLRKFMLKYRERKEDIGVDNTELKVEKKNVNK